ncbi:MAG: efflux transporter outer membrane subunit [Proteobacteria bacterium]|nr:efflux transporter outer membrane subunit [Pseudomonadota bacterium]
MTANRVSRLLSASVAALTAASLAGCAVGPNYHRPTAPVPATFKELEGWRPARPADAIDRGQWWTIFGDPDLDALEAKVVISNQNIAAAEAAYRAARALVAENRASYFPTVDLNAGATDSGGRTTQTTIVGGGSGSGGSGSSGKNSNARYTASVGASWAPDLWGRVRRAVEGARASAQASAADLANARLSAQAELASDYLQLRADDEQIRLLQRSAEGYQKALQVAQNRYNAGVAAKSEILSAQTQLYNAQASIQSTTQARQVLEHAIAMLTGQPPASLTIAPKPFDLKIPTVPVSVPSELLERRPDVAAAERRAANANAQIGVQVAAYYPTLNLSASYGFTSTTLGQLFSSGGWTLGLQAAETLFDGGARKARVNQAKAQYDQAVAQYRQAVLNAFQQVEDGLAAQRYLEAQDALRRKSSAAADQAEQIVVNQYRAGQASSTDVVTAENTALAARQALITTQRDRLTATVSLIEALGGGWSAAELPKKP